VLLYWLRQAGILLVIWIAVLAFPNVRQTPAGLRVIYKEIWRHKQEVLTDWRTELAGEHALSERVQAMLAMLRRNGAESFRFSAGVAADPDESVLQRLAEAAYPIRLRTDANILLQLAREPLDPQCQEVDRKLEIVLARCS
jgi:hypothetical protein